MPPLIIAVLLGAGAYAGYRTARQWWGKGAPRHGGPSETKVRQAEPETALAEKDLGALEFDPATGVYRPAPRA